MNAVRGSLLALALLIAWIGCQKKVDTVKIISIYPHTETALHAGKTVNVSVEIEYNLVTAASGTVAMIIQQEEEGSDPLKSVTRVIRKGKGTMVLEADVVVPRTNAVNVFTPLNVQGSINTDVVAVRTYEVVKE
jgi:hypothetical protein